MDDIKQLVKDHETRLSSVEQDVREIRDDLKSGLERVDQSNQYLREQNRDILKEVIKRNNLSENHNFEMNKIKVMNRAKMFGMIFGASGLATVLMQFIFKLIGR